MWILRQERLETNANSSPILNTSALATGCTECNQITRQGHNTYTWYEGAGHGMRPKWSPILLIMSMLLKSSALQGNRVPFGISTARLIPAVMERGALLRLYKP